MRGGQAGRAREGCRSEGRGARRRPRRRRGERARPPAQSDPRPLDLLARPRLQAAALAVFDPGERARVIDVAWGAIAAARAAGGRAAIAGSGLSPVLLVPQRVPAAAVQLVSLAVPGALLRDPRAALAVARRVVEARGGGTLAASAEDVLRELASPGPQQLAGRGGSLDFALTPHPALVSWLVSGEGAAAAASDASAAPDDDADIVFEADDAAAASSDAAAAADAVATGVDEDSLPEPAESLSTPPDALIDGEARDLSSAVADAAVDNAAPGSALSARAAWARQSLLRHASGALELAPSPDLRATFHALTKGSKTARQFAAQLAAALGTGAAADAAATVQGLVCEPPSEPADPAAPAHLSLAPPYALVFGLATNSQGRLLAQVSAASGGWWYGEAIRDDFAFVRARVAFILARPNLAAKLSDVAWAALAAEGLAVPVPATAPAAAAEPPPLPSAFRAPSSLAELAALPLVGAAATVSARTSAKLFPPFEYLRDLCAAEEGGAEEGGGAAADRAAAFLRCSGVHVLWWLQRLAEVGGWGTAAAYAPGGGLYAVGLTPGALRRVMGAVRSVRATGLITAAPTPQEAAATRARAEARLQASGPPTVVEWGYGTEEGGGAASRRRPSSARLSSGEVVPAWLGQARELLQARRQRQQRGAGRPQRTSKSPDQPLAAPPTPQRPA